MLTKTEVEALARKWRPSLPRDWRTEYWENLGWHFRFVNGRVCISYHQYQGDQGFHAMISDIGGPVGSSSGDWHDSTSYATPREAALAAAKNVAAYIKKRTEEFGILRKEITDALESIRSNRPDQPLLFPDDPEPNTDGPYGPEHDEPRRRKPRGRR